MENKGIETVLNVLDELKEDNTVPKNVRLKIEETIKILNEDSEMEIRVSKVLHRLGEISEDVNLQSYTRTQIWDVISELEKTKS